MRSLMTDIYQFLNDSGYPYQQFDFDLDLNHLYNIAEQPFTLIKLMVVLCVIAIGIIEIKKFRIKRLVHNLSQNAIEMTPEQFMRMRSMSLGGRGRKSYALTLNFAGVYILHNKTKDLYYVGQGKQVLNRVNAHFTGHGNGDVYADYKYGDQFTIRTIALENSGFSSLNALERYCISYYHAFYRGYNKPRGNR